MTSQEAAKRIGVTPIGIAQAIKEGRLRARRFGWAYAIELSDLLDFARNHYFVRVRKAAAAL